MGISFKWEPLNKKERYLSHGASSDKEILEEELGTPPWLLTKENYSFLRGLHLGSKGGNVNTIWSEIIALIEKYDAINVWTSY